MNVRKTWGTNRSHLVADDLLLKQVYDGVSMILCSDLERERERERGGILN